MKPETKKFNLTSEQVAREMVDGALRNSRANVTVANTGVAGPSNGDEDIPIATLYFAWGFEHAGNNTVFSETKRFDGNRNETRKAGADCAIDRILFYHRQLQHGKAATR